MQARIASAAQGARWLGEGWQLFRVAPLPWLALACVYLLGTNILALVPVVGFVAALMLVPALTVGMMAAARAASHGTPPGVRMLAEGFRGETRALLVLGAIYFLCSMLVFGGTALADPGGKLRAILGGRAPAGELALGEVILPLAVFALSYAPVLMMFWFAPPLAAWHSTGALKALFFSFVACLMNWRAFLAYGAAVTVMMMAVPLAALLVLRALGGADLGVAVASLVFPLLLLMLPTLFASFYVSYRDVFGVEKP
ncbi:MAG TPA: BPSS1780 family membrane protein [Burkholderiales bacterium]